MSNLNKTNNELSKIKTSLPYCLFRVDSRFFKLNDGDNTKIRFVKVKTVPNRRTSDSKNIDTIRDRWGIDAYSDVFILTEKIFNNSQRAKEFALKIINAFLKLYRYYDKTAVHLVDLNSEDLFGFNYMYKGRGVFEINLAGGITPANPLLNYQMSNEIDSALTSGFELPFWEELLMNSEQYIYQTNFRLSILESVIALEFITSKFITKKCKEKNISETNANNFIKDVGIEGNIKTTIKLLIDDNLPEDDLFGRCKAGINIRNKIVHKGKKDVNRNEAEDTLKANKQLIKFLNKYL
jgi:hypothetical protein